MMERERNRRGRKVVRQRKSFPSKKLPVRFSSKPVIRQIRKNIGTTTWEKKKKLYIDEEDFERVFEIRIRDLRERKGVKQKSFSISVEKGTKDEDYIDVDKLKKKLQKLIREVDNE